MKPSILPTDHPVLGAWLIGMVIGAFIGYNGFTPFLNLAGVRYEPMPHQVAKYPGGISLRFAMVHDVIHERFARHGHAYYRQRNANAHQELQKLSTSATTQPDDPRWRLMDDLAVGHVHLGQFDQAIALMRDKLAQQQKLGITGLALYSTYANLGTAMMIDAIVASSSGKEKRDELRDSLTWVRKSIEVNPQAHFGREVWQVVLGEFLLAVADDRKSLSKYDFLGEAVEDAHAYTGRPYNGRIAVLTQKVVAALDQRQIEQAQRDMLREWIAPIPVTEDWRSNGTEVKYRTVPFDEPVLGIVGMWRYGGGANPHFALALGEIMTRIGERHIAWTAYERTKMLLATYPDRAEASKLIDHCNERQSFIEKYIVEDPSKLRQAFQSDLKAGQDYQAAYQNYEAEQIAKGKSIDDPHFYDAFYAQHGDIASDPGTADWIKVKDEGLISTGTAPAILCAGLLALLAARLRAAWQSDQVG